MSLLNWGTAAGRARSVHALTGGEEEAAAARQAGNGALVIPGYYLALIGKETAENVTPQAHLG